MVLDYTRDLTPLVGEDGFSDPEPLAMPDGGLVALGPDRGTDPTPAPAKQPLVEKDLQLAIYEGLREEVPAVPTSSSFFGRFGDLMVDIVGKPLEAGLTALSWPGDTLERVVGMGYWALAYQNDLDLAGRWKLAGLTWEATTGRNTAEIMRRLDAGEDVTAVVEEFEGGWGDLLMKLVADPLNIFGVPGLGLAARALPAGSKAAQALRAANRGVTADLLSGPPRTAEEAIANVFGGGIADPAHAASPLRMLEYEEAGIATARSDPWRKAEALDEAAAGVQRRRDELLALPEAGGKLPWEMTGDEFERAFGSAISEVRQVPVDRLEARELVRGLDGTLTVSSEKQMYLEPYAERYRAGEVPPPLLGFAPTPGADEPYVVIDGARRLVAAQMAGVNELPVQASIVLPNGMTATHYGVVKAAVEAGEYVPPALLEAEFPGLVNDLKRAGQWDEVLARRPLDATRRPSELAAGFMRKIGLNETEGERIDRRITEALTRARAASHTEDTIRAAGAEWFARPDNWFRRLWEQTPESKRNEMGHTFFVNLRQNAETTPDWGRLRQYTAEILEGNVAGTLVADHPEWVLATAGSRFDQPAGLMAIQAIGDHAKALGKTVDDLPSMRKTWFEGPEEEWLALTPEARQGMFANRQQWVAQWEQDMYRLAGDGSTPGAFDYYAGLAVDYIDEGDSVALIPRARRGMEVVFEELDKLHGHAKGIMSIFWLNTPRYAMANAMSNTFRAVTALDFEKWRWDASLAEKFGGEEMLRLASADPARLKDMSLGAATDAAAREGMRDWIIKPFVKMGSENRWFGDNPLRAKIALLHAGRTVETNWGKMLPVLDFGEGVTPEAQAIVRAGLLESWSNPRDFLQSLRDGRVGLTPSRHAYELALDDMGVKGDARWLFRDLLGPDVEKQLDVAFEAAKTPDELAAAYDRIARGELVRQYGFQPIEGSIVKGARPHALFERRVLEEQIVVRAEQERTAAFKRVVEMKGGDSGQVDELIQPFVREQQQRLRRLYEVLDLEVPFGVEGAQAARLKVLREHDRWVDKEWTRITNALRKTYAREGLGDYFKGVNADRLVTERAIRSIRNEFWGDVQKLGEQRWMSDDAQSIFDTMDAIRHNEWNSHLDRLMAPFGLSRIEYTRAVPGDGAFSMSEGFVQIRESTAELLGRMQAHAADLFVQGEGGAWTKKAAVLTPEQSARVLNQLGTLEEDASLLRGLALRSGQMMSDHALLNYDRKFGIDSIAKFAFPYHFWPSRMTHRFMRAGLARPGAAGAFADLLNGINELTEGMPVRFRGKVGIPVPFLPEWMGNEIYFDPLKMLFPFAQGLHMQEIEGDTFLGTVENWMSGIGAGAAPWITMPLQMSGALGEREKWVRYMAQGMPFGLPGTAAQQAVTSFLAGDPSPDWDGDLTPEDVRNLTLGEAFPEPRLREILGIPPGDQWDFYRVLRSLASMAGDGTVTAEEALKAVKLRAGPTWETAKDRAAKENAIRNLTSWGLGMGGSIYPKGEAIQDGLKILFDAAREADRKGATDGNTSAFFDAFPEYQVRQVQKAFYRGQEELDAEVDTSLYFIDLAAVQEEFTPQIGYWEQVAARLPKGQRKPATDRVQHLYDERARQMDRLGRIYAKRRTTPSVYAPPHERALRMLREQWYALEGDTVAALMGAREAFLDRFTGKGMAPTFYAFTGDADRVLAEYDARLADASNNERDGIYRERSQAIEELTQRASRDLSAQDFLDFVAARKRQPGDEEARRQKNADALRMLFHAPEEQRAAILREHPDLESMYGRQPDPALAGVVNAWWAHYEALAPNSMARDDYVQAESGRLNAVRAALGLPELRPRERPAAGPLVQYEDPYLAALTAEVYRNGQ